MRNLQARMPELCQRAKRFCGCKARLCYDLRQHMAETRA